MVQWSGVFADLYSRIYDPILEASGAIGHDFVVLSGACPIATMTSDLF